MYISCNRWGSLPDKNGQKQKFWVSESLALCFEWEDKISTVWIIKKKTFLSFLLSLSTFPFTFKSSVQFCCFSDKLLSCWPLNYSITCLNFKACFIWFPYTYMCVFSHTIFSVSNLIQVSHEDFLHFDSWKWESIIYISINH